MPKPLRRGILCTMLTDTFGHYQVLEKIGEGGMGTVYKARDTRLGRMVALKILASDKAGDHEQTAMRAHRFTQEAKSASALNHPNIITIYDTGSENGIDYIAMEYVAGRTLDALIGRSGLRISEALRYARQMADALAAAHAAGILHRDLKPANVMVNEAGLVKVLDFGLAQQTLSTETGDDAVTQTLGTQAGTIVGTIAYMSPEQAEGRKLDFRSDIFSFGAVLYEMLTGRRPFTGSSQAATLAAILQSEPRPLSALREDIPPEIEKLIARCLRKDPARRVQSMADLRVALEDLEEESKSSGGPAARARTRKLLPWPAVAAVAGVLLAAAGGGYWLIETTSAKQEGPISAVPLTGNEGLESGPSFSPDGNQVAYAWDGEKEDNQDIYVKLIGPGAPLRLTTDPAPDRAPVWSPDGRSIAFVRDEPDDREAIMLIPALGGAERKLADVFMRFGGRPLCWAPDSQHLIVSGQDRPQDMNGLFVLTVSTGEKHQLSTPPSATIGGDGFPAISPDGKTLAFVRGPSGARLDIFTLGLTADLRPVGEPRQITFDKRRSMWPTWSPDGRDIIYVSFVQGRTDLWRVAANGSGRPEPLAGVGEGARTLAISPGAHRLVYARHLEDQNVWRIEVTGGKAGPAVRLIASTLRDFEPRYAADGRKLSYTSDRSGYLEVWTADADGSNQVQLTDMSSSLTSGGRWSPDGQRIVFLSVVGDQQELFTVPAGGGAVTRLTNNPAHDTAPSWSHDGKWIYFGSNRGGQFQVWKMPAQGGDAIQITRKGGYAALESSDGQYLYYARRSPADGIWKVPAGGGEETQVIPAIDTWGNFAVTEHGIYFVPPEKGVIQFYDFATRHAKTVAKADKPLDFGLDATEDGRFVLYTRKDRESDELLLVDHFR